MKVKIRIEKGHEHILPDVLEYVKKECRDREQAETKWGNMANNNIAFEHAMVSISYCDPNFRPAFSVTYPEPDEPDEPEEEK